MSSKVKQKQATGAIVKSPDQPWTPRRWSKEVLSAIPWNDYQMRVFEALEESTDNLVVSSTAGSGKSTLLKGIIGLLPPNAKINVMMFNVSVKDAFEKDPRIPKRVTVSTAHGCGYGLLIGYFRGDAPQVDDNKAHKLSEWGLKRLKELMGDKSRYHPVPLPTLPENAELAEILLEKWQDALKQLIDFARLNLANNDVESLEWVANYFAIRFPFGKRGIAWGIRIAIDLLEDCFRMGAYDRQIDYADMVWLPHKLKLYPRKPKAPNAYLLVDECVTGDTLVTLADGSTRRIDEIVDEKLQLQVLSFNEQAQEIEVKPITGWHKVPRRGRKIVDVNGLKATFDHPVYTHEHGWVEAGQLGVHNQVMYFYEQTGIAFWEGLRSSKAAIECDDEWVYCIDVEDNHNFFGNGILSHNCQDANRAFISLYKKYELVGYRCIFVGDIFQSVGGFMGALPTAVDTIIKLFNAKVLPLSESQRCPKSHVALASLISPDMRARQDAIEGTCELMRPEIVKESVQPGNLVLCRFVAPLIKLFLEAKFFAEKQGVVRARDIAKEMKGLAKQVGKNCKWSNFHSKLLEQKEYLVERYKLAGQLTQADATEDRYRCLEYCHEFLGVNTGSLKEFVEKIEEAFPVEEEDRMRHVIYSSIHSAKGDESQSVYIVGINLLPYYRMGMLNWQFQQEIYATFVALTRSKSAMYFVPLERDLVELEKLMQLPCAGLKMEYFEGHEGEK